MEQQMNNAFSFARGEGKTYWFDGNLLEIKATGEETNGIFSLLEGLHPPGYENPMHYHRSVESVYYILEGEATFVLGANTIKGKPGTFVYAPRNTAHKFKIEGNMPAKMLVMFTPAGIEQFFVELGVPADDYKLPPNTIVTDFEKLMAAAQKYDVEIIG